MDLRTATIADLTAAYHQGDLSPVEVVTSALDTAKQDDAKLEAYVSFRDQSISEAREAEHQLKISTAGRLTGIPVAIKDNLDLAGEATTAGSKILKDYRAVFTATAVERLRQAGAVIIGKTNLDEFAMGGSTENSGFHPTHNPWDHEVVPGGSSGGSAATVAAGHVPAALGSDTGGSVRQPASFCGVVGVKPTYGRVSRSGLIALASSFDTIGPLTRTVADAATMYEIIAGPDRDDATTADRPVEPVLPHLTGDITGLRIGLPTEYFGPGVEPDVAAAIKEAVKVYERLGATVTEISIPHAALGLPTYYVILPAEASSNLARYDGIRYGSAATEADTLLERYAVSRDHGFGPEVKRRIMIGTYVLSAGYADQYYRQARKVQALLKEEFHQVFDEVDVLLTPTAPTKPFKLGARTDDPLQMYMTDLLTVGANLTGIPAMSVPAGFAAGLPIGLQIMAKQWDEVTMFQAAYAFEQATDWHTQHPPHP